MKKRVLLILLSILLLGVLAVGGIGLSYYLDSRNHAYTMDVSMGPTEKTLVEEDVLSYALVNNSYAPVQIREIVVLSVYDESGTPVPAEGSAYAASLAGVEELENAGRKAVQDNQVIYVTEYAVEAGKVSFEEYFQHREETENIHQAVYTLQHTDCSFQADVILQGKCREEDDWQTLCSSTDTVGMENPAAIQPAIPDLTHAVSYQWSVAEGVAYLNGLGSIPEREILIPAWVQLAATESGYVHDPIDGAVYPVMVGDQSLSYTDVRKVTFEDGVQIADNTMGSFERGFFENCKDLVAVQNIPDTVTSMVFTFKGCSALQQTPVIPDSVDTMKYVFQNCTALMDVLDLPDSIMNMDGCFDGCTALQRAPVVPENVNSMKYTFKNCTALEDIPALPEMIVDMEGCFYGCTLLKVTPALPDEVTNLKNCFYGCSALTEVTNLPASVENMSSCFENCVGLQRIPALPEKFVQYVGCFRGCTSLAGDLELPAGATDWEHFYNNIENMFSKCENINSIVVQCCRNADIIKKLPEGISVTFAQEHITKGTCPGCHSVTDSYEVDGLAVQMDNIPEPLVAYVIAFLDDQVPDELKETCRALTFTKDLGKYSYLYGDEKWRGFATWPDGRAYVRILEGDQYSRSPAWETQAMMLQSLMWDIKRVVFHELGHCYDHNFSMYARHSDSAAWRQLCQMEGDAMVFRLEKNYSKSQYPVEMFAIMVEQYFGYGDPSIVCPQMMEYVTAIFDEAA